MANKNNNNRKNDGPRWPSLNKLSFYLIVATAILYLVAMILSCVGGLAGPVMILQGVANAIMICIVAVLAYRYIRNKPTVWLVLYIVVLLVVLVGIVIPAIMIF